MKAKVFCTAEEERVCRSIPVHIKPSDIDPWQGTYVGDERFSRQQLYRLREEGRDPETIDFVDVEVSAARWLAAGCSFGTMPFRKMACPILGTRGERLLVLSPYGMKKLVYPNGEISRRPERRIWR